MLRDVSFIRGFINDLEKFRYVPQILRQRGMRLPGPLSGCSQRRHGSQFQTPVSSDIDELTPLVSRIIFFYLTSSCLLHGS